MKSVTCCLSVKPPHSAIFEMRRGTGSAPFHESIGWCQPALIGEMGAMGGIYICQATRRATENCAKLDTAMAGAMMMQHN